MLKNIKVILNVDYLKNKEYFNSITKKIIYTGAIDAYFDYKLGYLEYRTLNFEHEFLNSANYQGNAVVNYTDKEIPWTRIIEHKWFEFGKDIEGNKIDKTIISKEYSVKWTHNDEPYYPINNEVNNNLYNKYRLLANLNKNIIFGGRLGEYKYYDMDKVIESVLMLVNIELK